MPRKQPTKSFLEIRNYTEKFRWNDPITGQKQTGFNPPENAPFKERVPFFIRYITQEGKVQSGNVVCISVDTRHLQRSIKFVNSTEIRRVCDYLIIEIDGVRFLTH